MGFFIPKTLQSGKRWILWRYEIEGDRQTKKPYSAYYDGPASVTNPKTWAYLSQAQARLKYGDFSGLGYVFTKGDGLTFIDLDHCIDDSGELSPFAREIIALFPKTYTEYSVSETGLHLIVKGSVPAAYKSDQIEIYSAARYVALTGNAIEVLEPQPAQEALNELVERYKITAAQAVPLMERTAPGYSDKTVLQRARKGGNGPVFAELWAGAWADRYESQSQADLRLVSILYYYSRNRDQVKALFLESGLGQREKAHRPDYIDRLIDQAAQRITDQDAQKRARSPQEPAKGQRGINTLPGRKNGAQSRTAARRRANLTDTPDNKRKRAFRK